MNENVPTFEEMCLLHESISLMFSAGSVANYAGLTYDEKVAVDKNLSAARDVIRKRLNEYNKAKGYRPLELENEK